MSDLKNVVIVGAASTGAHTARNLAKTLPATHRVILIDSAESIYHPVSGLRASVQPGFEKEVLRPLKTFFKDGQRHITKPLTKVVTVSEDHVVTDAGETIPFDQALFATGTNYASPGRQASTKHDESIAALQKAQEEVKHAKNILVLGGGAVGVEWTGEVVAQHGVKSKKITLVSAGAQLIGPQFSPKLHAQLIPQLDQAGVTTILGDEIDASDLHTGPLASPQTFTTKGGKIIPDVDYVFVGFGNGPNSQVFRAFDPEAIEAGTAFVKVNPQTLKVETPKSKRWWAGGDVSNAPGGKVLYQTEGQAATIAANILATIQAAASGAEPNLKNWKPMPLLCAVPFGPSGGAIQLPFVGVWGKRTVSMIKGKTLFVSQHHSLFQPA